MSSQRFLDCMAMQPRGGFSSKSHDCFEEKAGISFLFFPFITNDGLRPITNPIYTKKAVGHLPIRKRGSRSPCAQTGNTPRISQGAFYCFMCTFEFSTFRLHRNQLNAFFLQKHKNMSIYDSANIRNY